MKKRNSKNSTFSNADSFELFFKKHYHLACLVALQYVKDYQQAEDIAQETFLALWQKRNQLYADRNPKQYLLNAVKNRCINFLQRERKVDQLSVLEIEEPSPDGSNDNYDSEELAVQVADSIDHLPPQCKKIFLLAYKSNLTYNEIASLLNISKNTVKTQMGIAYKLLRSRLRKYFVSMFSLLFRPSLN